MADLTPAQRALIHRQLALIPVYVWMVYSWPALLNNVTKPEPVRDFAHFYIQGVIAREHDAAALYDLKRMAEVSPRVLPGGQYREYPPVYGPQVSMFFAPLTLLPYTSALKLWLAITVAVYVGCVFAIWRVCPRLRSERWTLIPLALGAPMLHYALGFVQVSALAMLCVTAGYLALRRHRLFLAGLALGSLAYKPPLAIAVACVLLAAREWRMIGGAIAAVVVQIGIGVAYWGPAILPAYVRALLRVPDALNIMEVNVFYMHAWRPFFLLMGLPDRIAVPASILFSVLTIAVAFRCWRARGPLALRYSALLIATVLVDPHLYAYDLVVLAPAFLLLWDDAGREPELTLGQAFPGISRPLARLRYEDSLEWVLLFCYLVPILGPAADYTGIQTSVPTMALLGLIVASRLRRPAMERHESETAARPQIL